METILTDFVRAITGGVSWADVAKEIRWPETIQALISIIGFVAVVCQIRRLKRTVQGETHSELYTHYLEVNKLFLEKTHLRPYFYDSKELNQSDKRPRLRQQLDSMCEIVLGLLEHAVLQKVNLPGDSWRNCWMTYVRERLDKSPELKNFFRANEQWYAQALRDIIHGQSTGVVARRCRGVNRFWCAAIGLGQRTYKQICRAWASTGGATRHFPRYP
jgi:hypothetical protein